MASLLSRLTNLHHDMAAGSTRSESAILQMARSLNATDAQMQAVRNSLQQIAGLSASPFDSSLGAIRSVQREMQALNDRAQLAAQGISLTTNQLQEFSRIGNEIRGKMSAQALDHSTTAGAAHYTAELKKQQDAYLLIAGEVNRTTLEEKKRNDNLKAQAAIMADLEQKNLSMQEAIKRNQAITSGLQTGASQGQAGTQYDNARLIAGAATPEQLARIQERITLTAKLTDSEKALNTEIKNQNDLLKHIEGIVAQQKAIQDLNKAIVDNVQERIKMDALVQKYTTQGLNATNAKELSQLEMKGASQASISSLQNYLMGIQQVVKARESQKAIEDEVDRANQKTARDAASARYSAQGFSSAVSGQAAGMEVKGVPASVIATYTQEATTKEKAAKATRELAAANKYVTETEERLAQAVNNANQNLNRQSTDELTKYQKALATVGTTTDETTRKMAALKAQLDLVAGKERQNQLNHLSRAISTQMGDVGISLASGMNPLTVMLQQGDQIRFALQQAGAEGKELQMAMSGAASQIASSIALTAKALGGFFVGTLTSMGSALSSFVLNTIGATKHIRDLEVALVISAAAGGTFSNAALNAFNVVRTALIALTGIITGGTLAALVMLSVGFYKVMKEQEKLAVQLALTGGSMGVSMDSAVNYALAMNEVGISTGRATEVITAMAKEGGFLAGEISMITKAAVDMEQYAGVSIEDTIKQFSNLRKDPVEAIQELAMATGMIAPEVVRAVIELKEQGKTADAVALSMKTLADVTDKQVGNIKEDFTDFAILMKDVSRDVSNAFADMFKGMWIKTPVNEALRETRKALLSQVAEMEQTQADNKSVLDFFGIKTDTSKLDEMKAKIANINRTLRNNEVKQQNDSQEKENNASAAKLSIDAETLKNKYAEKSVILEKERAGIVEKRDKALSLNLKKEADIFDQALGGLDKRIKEARDSEAKKERGPKPTKSSFGGVASPVSLVDNTSNLQRIYSSELSKQQKFIKAERDSLKLRFEAGLVSRGEYITKDINLINQGQTTELATIAKHGDLIKAEHDKMLEAIEARRSDALRANKDPVAAIKINKDANDQIARVTEAYTAFQETQSDKKDVIGFETTRRYLESIKEQNLALIDSKKHLTDLNKSMRDISESRLLDIEFQFKAMSLSGSELESYKARNEVLKEYAKTKDRLRNSVKNETQVYDDMVANTDGSRESQDRIVQQWQIVQTLKDEIVKASIASEEQARIASIDSVSKYYLSKAMEVRDGTANAITEGIMNGGQAGSKAIKSVLDNILKDLLNNVFKKILGSVGDMILQSIMQAQVASSASSSGGGFLQTLVSAGMSAFAGGMGGGTGGGTGNPLYALGNGSNTTSGFKMRAVGGFVNQGSEYMVGENGPEKFIPKQTGSIVPNHKLTSDSKASSEPMKVTIINNTSAQIGKVTERQISPTERALVIEDAVAAVASAMYDPNHKVSKSFGQNYSAQRKR